VLNLDDIQVAAIDFQKAMKGIVPASQRAVVQPGRALAAPLKPLLEVALQQCLDLVKVLFPPGKPLPTGSQPADSIDNWSSDEEDGPSIYEPAKTSSAVRRGKRSGTRSNSAPVEENNTLPVFFSDEQKQIRKDAVNRPRLLIHGVEGNGQATHLAPALLYSMEHLTVHTLDLPALYGNSATAPEEAIAQLFREARRTAPAVVYLPHINIWWSSISDTSKATFMTLLYDLPPSMPVFLLATSDAHLDELHEAVHSLFISSSNEAYQLDIPSKTQSYQYFKDLFLVHAMEQPIKAKTKVSLRVVEELAVAPAPPPRTLSKEEEERLFESEEHTLRELRQFLRQCTWKLIADRKYKEFSRPVDLEEVRDYLEVVTTPMDLSTMMTRINSHVYTSTAHYLSDIDLIMHNCLEYNPDRDQMDKLLRNRVCELRDTAYAIINKDLDPDFEKLCIEIHENREKRGFDSSRINTAPAFMRVLPKHMHPASMARGATIKPTTEAVESPSVPEPTGSRFSKRVRGIQEPCVDFAVADSILEARKPRRSKTLEEKETNADETEANESNNTNSKNTESKSDSDKENINTENINQETADDPMEEGTGAGTTKDTPKLLAEELSTEAPLDGQVSAEHQYAKTSPSKSISSPAKLNESEKVNGVSPMIELNDSLEEKEAQGSAVKRSLNAMTDEAPPSKRVTMDPSNISLEDDKEVSALDQMKDLLDDVVSATENFAVSALERVYAQICHVICQHRSEAAKTLLIKDLRTLVSNLKEL